MKSKDKPTNKVSAGALAGALTLIVVWGVKLAGVDVPAEVGIALSTVFSFGLSYWVKDAE